MDASQSPLWSCISFPFRFLPLLTLFHRSSARDPFSRLESSFFWVGFPLFVDYAFWTAFFRVGPVFFQPSDQTPFSFVPTLFYIGFFPPSSGSLRWSRLGIWPLPSQHRTPFLSPLVAEVSLGLCGCPLTSFVPLYGEHFPIGFFSASGRGLWSFFTQ